ncbi:PD-(D/E)XK nuclease domain-containing protein, partial [Rickettsia argasii]
MLHVDIKASNIKLEDNRELGDHVLSINAVKVKPLQLGKNTEGEDKILDDILSIMSNSKTATAKIVESFFYQLREAYHNNNKQNVLRMVEAAYHGFTYGALILNYHVKYGVDAYVEQSAGRGFLDLYFLLRKNNGNDVPNAVKIIVEFKGTQIGDSNSIMSVTDAVKQIEERAYAFQFVGRTESKNVIIVGADFGATGETVQAKMPKTIDLPKQSFISKLIDARQATLDHTTIKQALKTIYDSTRSDESLDKVILGDLLSSNVVEKNVFTIKDFPNGQRVSMFVFKNQYQKAVILTCIEQEN